LAASCVGESWPYVADNVSRVGNDCAARMQWPCLVSGLAGNISPGLSLGLAATISRPSRPYRPLALLVTVSAGVHRKLSTYITASACGWPLWRLSLNINRIGGGWPDIVFGGLNRPQSAPAFISSSISQSSVAFSLSLYNVSTSVKPVSQSCMWQ